MSSDSDLLNLLETIQLYDYSPIIIITVVVYDYFLTFSREVDIIWCRRWTWVSTLFVVVRYLGLCWAITLSLAGNTFAPGPVAVSIALVEMGDWGYILYLAAADLVMILRVYAMWNRSKIVLWVLMFIHIVQIVLSIVWEAVYVWPGATLSAWVDQTVNFEYCSYSTTEQPLPIYRAIPRFIIGAALLTLFVIPTLTHTYEIYRLTGRWHINRAMQLLVKEGAVYFVVNLLYNIVGLVQLSNASSMLFFDTFAYSLSCVVMPRFVISIRELYLQDQWQGIDTGFGVYIGPMSSENVGVSTLPWHVQLQESRSGLDTIVLEEVGGGMRRV
ncbi:hypothetical protein HD554DRAFT_1770382 [Boletus coccyginus]|nr:hypothetical protein HD554DRAFT_1770382 [Boletus coccyginus]